MKNLSVNELREAFLKFFAEKNIIDLNLFL